MNQLSEMTQFRKALIVAKQLLRDGILTGGPASIARRKDGHASVLEEAEAAPEEEAVVRRIVDARVPPAGKKRMRCSVDECTKHIVKGGMCQRHNRENHGEPPKKKQKPLNH